MCLSAHTHKPTHAYPLGSFWIFIKESPTAGTDRWAGVLTPGFGRFPIKTHRSKNIPPHWPRQQTWSAFTSVYAHWLPVSLSCPSHCSTQHIYLLELCNKANLICIQLFSDKNLCFYCFLLTCYNLDAVCTMPLCVPASFFLRFVFASAHILQIF